METNATPLPLQIGQHAKKKPIETHNYPKESIVEYSETGRSYTYDIIEEGYYHLLYILNIRKAKVFEFLTIMKLYLAGENLKKSNQSSV